jgi:ProP effector
MSITSDQEAAEVLALLCQRFPLAFFLYQGKRRPLKVGIRADVEAALGADVEGRPLGRAFNCYTINVGYQRSLKAGTPRIDLNGLAAGVVSEDDASFAKRLVAALLGKKKRRQKQKPKRDSLASLRAAARKRRQTAGMGGGA